MSTAPQLYRFRIELSDIDRGVYETLDFRTAQHPSEAVEYLITRVLAYLHSYSSDLAFSPLGLGDPDVPPLAINKIGGGHALWIEIGNPSAKRLHRASKNSDQVRIYTYKDPLLLKREVDGEKVHRVEAVEVYPIPSSFLKQVAASLTRDVRWSVMVQDQTLTIHGAENVFSFQVSRIALVA